MNISENSPLITLALFAYNQEEYIESALRAALAQTYENLEVLASDDGSSDRTFAIIEKIADEYQGPHRLKINQNKRNLGIAGHINKVYELASGEIIVSAAGDDISLPERVSTLADVYQNSGSDTMVVYSDGWITDKNGVKTGEVGERVTAAPPYDLKQLIEKPQYLVGATMAWRRDLMRDFGPMILTTKNEDIALLYRAFISGKVVFCADKLVEWRRIEGSLSAQENDVLKSRVRSYGWLLAIYEQITADLKACAADDVSLISASSRQADRYACLLGIWQKPVGLLKALGYAIRFKSAALLREAIRAKLIPR